MYFRFKFQSDNPYWFYLLLHAYVCMYIWLYGCCESDCKKSAQRHFFHIYLIKLKMRRRSERLGYLPFKKKLRIKKIHLLQSFGLGGGAL
jgi:hypothetical protein